MFKLCLGLVSRRSAELVATKPWRAVAFALAALALAWPGLSVAAQMVSSSPTPKGEINLFREISQRWYNRNFAEHMLFGLEIELLVDQEVPAQEHQRYVAGRIVEALSGTYDDEAQVVRGSKVGDLELIVDKSTVKNKGDRGAVEIITRPLSLSGVAQIGKLLDRLGDDGKIFDTRDSQGLIGIHINVATGPDRTHAQLVTNAAYNYFTNRRKLMSEEPSYLGREEYIADISPRDRKWLQANPSFFASKEPELAFPPGITSAVWRAVNFSYVASSGAENRIEFRYPDTVLGSTDPQSPKYLAGSRHLNKHIRFIAGLMYLSSLGRIDGNGKLKKEPAGLLGTVPDSKRFLRAVDKAVRNATGIPASDLSVMKLADGYRLLSANRHILAGPFTVQPRALGSKLLVTHEPGHGGTVLRSRETGEQILAGFDAYEELFTSKGLFVAAEKSGLRHLFSRSGAPIALPVPGGKAGVMSTAIWEERDHIYLRHGRELFVMNTPQKPEEKAAAFTFSGPLASTLERLGRTRFEQADTPNGTKALFFEGRPVQSASPAGGMATFDSVRQADPQVGFLSYPQLAVGDVNGQSFLVSSDKGVSPEGADDYVKMDGTWMAFAGGRYFDIDPNTLAFSKQGFERVRTAAKGVRIGYDNGRRYLLDQRGYFQGGSEQALEVGKIRSKFGRRLQVVHGANGEEQVIFAAGGLLSRGVRSMRKVRGLDMALLEMPDRMDTPSLLRLNLENNMIDAMTYGLARKAQPHQSSKKARSAGRAR